MAVDLQETTLSGTFTADAYRSLVDLFGFPSQVRVFMVEGFIDVALNGATFRTVPPGTPAPATADPGGPRAAGGVMAFGPASGAYKGYPLHAVYARNTTAGSNAQVIAQGVFRIEVP